MSSVSNTINTQNVVDTPVENENQALNVLVTFLSMAHRREHLIYKNLLKFGNVFKNLIQ